MAVSVGAPADADGYTHLEAFLYDLRR